jgi:hypothetical protein
MQRVARAPVLLRLSLDGLTNRAGVTLAKVDRFKKHVEISHIPDTA